MDYVALAIAIVFGALSGIFAGLMGFAKTIIPMIKMGLKPEDIDYTKMFQTIILGAIIGALAGYKGIPYEEAQALFYYLAETMGLTVLLDWCVKIIARSLAKRAEEKVKTTLKKNPKKKAEKKPKKDEEE